MALFNEINVGRVNRALQKYFGIKGGPPAPTLSSDVTVNWPLHTGNENLYLEGVDLFGVALGQAAVAAATSGVRLRNPSGSNVVATIIKLMISVGVADTSTAVRTGAVGVDFATIATPLNFDSRGRQTPTLIGSVQSTPVAGGLTTIGQMGLLANTPIDYLPDGGMEIPLLPGRALQVDTTVQNVLLGVSIIWRERFLEEGERA